MTGLLAAAKAFIAELDSSGDFANWERCKARLREEVEKEESAGLEISRVLILSTRHIEPESMERLECLSTVFQCDYGALLSTSNTTPHKWPEDIDRVLTFARDKGCSYVMWDRDGEEVEELPTFDW